LCWVAIGGNGEYDVNGTAEEWGIGRFMSTASVATDMLRITEKLGQKKLKYWGFSYGSVLGQYFTAMYPDKVGRVIIDGVFDATNYRASLWSTNLVDTDAIYDSIFELCHAAGPSKCPIYEPTVKETKDRALRIAQSLVDSPIALPFTTKGPIIMTSSMLYKYTFAALYTPLKVFKILTEALLAIETRNDTALVDIIESNVDAGFRCNCTQQRLPSVSDSSDPFHAIACGDGEKLSDKPGEYEAWVANLTATSAFGAPALSAMYLRCAEWKITPKWRYTGPLSTNESFSDSPILIISPKYDPVCPLSDAKRVQGRYAGS
jgi:pimeloyl-ACP methyl ester carboxylesterase